MKLELIQKNTFLYQDGKLLIWFDIEDGNFINITGQSGFFDTRCYKPLYENIIIDNVTKQDIIYAVMKYNEMLLMYNHDSIKNLKKQSKLIIG
jgi:hypothetical protein